MIEVNMMILFYKNENYPCQEGGLMFLLGGQSFMPYSISENLIFLV